VTAFDLGEEVSVWFVGVVGIEQALSPGVQMFVYEAGVEVAEIEAGSGAAYPVAGLAFGWKVHHIGSAAVALEVDVAVVLELDVAAQGVAAAGKMKGPVAEMQGLVGKGHLVEKGQVVAGEKELPVAAAEQEVLVVIAEKPFLAVVEAKAHSVVERMVLAVQTSFVAELVVEHVIVEVGTESDLFAP